MQDDDEDTLTPCPYCGGPLILLGQLGRLLHSRCRDCGAQCAQPTDPPRRPWDRSACTENPCTCHDDTADAYECSACQCRPAPVLP